MNKEFSQEIDKLLEASKKVVELPSGLKFDMGNMLKTIAFYSQSEYIDGPNDEVGRRKPFMNIVNAIVEDEVTNTDPDIKNISFIADGSDKARTLLLRRRFLNMAKKMKPKKLSAVINGLNEAYARNGGVIAKRTYDENGNTVIGSLEWMNVSVDPVDIMSNPIIEHHYMNESDLRKKIGVWDKNAVKEAMKMCKIGDGSKNDVTSERVEILEIEGEFPLSYLNDNNEEVPEDEEKFGLIRAYVAIDGKKKVLLWSKEISERQYKYAKRKASHVVGRGLGLGVVEEGIPAQVSVNEIAIAERDAFTIGSKILAKSNKADLEDTVLSDLPNGAIISLDDNEDITPLILTPSMMPEFNNLMDKWKENYRRSSGVTSNVLEPKASTPFRSVALSTAVASGGANYRREGFDFFIEEIISDWILPDIAKSLSKQQILDMDFTPTELQAFDNAFSRFEAMRRADQIIRNRIITGQEVTPDMYSQAFNDVINTIQQTKTRKLEIPNGYFDDLYDKITILIDDEFRDRKAEMESLFEMYQTLPPNDTNRPIIWEQMVELGGVMSPASFITTGTSAPQSQTMPGMGQNTGMNPANLSPEQTAPTSQIIKGVQGLLPNAQR